MGAGSTAFDILVALFLFTFFVPIFPDTLVSVSIFGVSASVSIDASLSFFVNRFIYGAHVAVYGISAPVGVGSGYNIACHIS